MLGGGCNQCCGGYCIVWKSEGWSGWLADVDSSVINGDGGASLPTLSVPFTVLLESERYVQMSVLCEENLVRVTLSFSLSGYSSSRIVLERTGPHGLLDGNIVSVSNVVENTVPGDIDEYNKKAVDATGSIYLKVERANTAEGKPFQCNADCSPNFFKTGYLSYADTPSTPETMTLQITNIATQPSGPRSESYAGSKYAGFLPPNSVREYSGCDSYLDRFTRPIVLRRVQGTFYTYLSDPIAIRPCCQVRYRFDACPACYTSPFDCGRNPRLYVSSVMSSLRPLATHPSSYIFGDPPLSSWRRSEYMESPESWQESKDSAVYSFGNFAVVSPGGAYEPEQQLLCGGTIDDGYSLAEGCFGLRCPPEEIEVEIAGGDMPALAGTYVVPAISHACLPYYGFSHEYNYFAGFRSTYQKTFERAGLLLSIAILRNSSSGWFWIARDLCGCEQRPVGLQVHWQPVGLGGYGSASTNVTRYPETGRCLPLCFDETSEAIFDNVTLQQTNIGGSTFPSIGQVIVRFMGQ